MLGGDLHGVLQLQSTRIGSQITNHNQILDFVNSILALYFPCMSPFGFWAEWHAMQRKMQASQGYPCHVASNPFPENPWKRDKAHTLGQRYENLQCDKNNSTDPSITCIIFLRIDLVHKIVLTFTNINIQAPSLSHITRRKVTSPNVNARWRKVTSHGGKSHHFVTIPLSQRHPTENLFGQSQWHSHYCKTNKVLRTTAKMIHEPLLDMKKVIKILWEHRLNTKAQGMQMKAQKQQSTTHNRKNDTWTIAGYEKSHQNTVGTKAKYEGTGNADESAKATKYYAQQQKWYMNHCRIWKKSSKYCGNTG